MLSIVNAAEAQFRYEASTRAREHTILAQIRERAAAGVAAVEVTVAPRRAPRTPALAPGAWARPIHSPACVVA